MKSVFKILVFSAIILSSISSSFSQITFWSEDFSSEGNGTITGNNDNTVNPAADWTTSCATCNRPTEFSVQGGSFETSNTDEVATWTSETISLAGYSNIGVTIDLSESGNLENSDQITVSYILDGGTKTQFPTNGFFSNDFGSAVASVSGLSGTTLVIIIDVITNETNESIFFDNINVSGILANNPPLAFIIWNNQPANKVYGQPNFTTNTATVTQTGANNPYHTAVDPTTGKVFIADINNNRVLRYPNINSIDNGEPAEAVLGQTNFTSNGAATTQSGFNTPAGIHIGPTGTLWVSEFNNHRVLRFDNASSKLTGANADGVLGQPDFVSGAANRGGGVAANGFRGPLCVFEEDDGTLWVADLNNQRALRYDNAAAKANGANADGVLGQPNFTTSGVNTAQNRTGAVSGVSVNTSGRLYVSDLSGNRVLWWDNAKAKANGANADGVLGQTNYTNNGGGLSRREFNEPRMVSVSRNNKFLSVSDALNNRTMIFINPGGVIGEVDADFEFGQPDFVSNTANNGGLSASSINNPRGVFLYQTGIYENYLFVSDRGNNRTKLYVLFDVFLTTDVFTPVSDTMQATEIDGDVLTFSVVDTSDIVGTFVIDDANTGEYTYTPSYRPQDYVDTVIYQVCDKDGCDTSVILFSVLTSRRLWVKADVGTVGSPLVTKWENQSIANDTLTSPTGEEPTYIDNSINFNPSLSFNGSSQNIEKVGGTINRVTDVHASLFIVSKARSVKNQYLVHEPLVGVNVFSATDVNLLNNSIFEAGTILEQSIAWGGTLNTPYLWSFIQRPTTENISRNALEISSKAGGSVLGDGNTLTIGSNNIDFYDGNIAEVMEFQNTLGSDFAAGEVNIIESYLAIKYGLTLDQTNDNDNDATLGTDYTLSDGSTVWEDAVSTIYINDIAGIGRDDNYGLYQRQSKSENPDGIVTIGLDTITTHNLNNPSIFSNDLTALMWANNNGSLASWVTTETQYGYNIIYRIEREWLVEENNGDVGDLKIQVDSADLPIPPMGPNKPLYVVVDEDGDGDFSTGELRLTRLTKTSGVWEGDINLADGEYFTFMYIHFDIMRHGKFFFNRKEQSYEWYQNL